MKKILIILLIGCAILFSVSCTHKKLYITSEMTGYIYNNVTKKPLNGNNIGEISFNGIDKAQKITLKDDGSFTLNPLIESYYFMRPNTKVYEMLPPEIYIDFQNFKIKNVDFSQDHFERIVEEKMEFRSYKKIYLGVIYLEPQ